MTRIPLSAADEQRRLMKQRLELSTAEIGLTVRTTNCLEEKGIFTVRASSRNPATCSAFLTSVARRLMKYMPH